MRVASKGKVNHVYGSLMGQKISTKVEIFDAFEFVNNSSIENKRDFDIKFIGTKRDLDTQIFPKFDIARLLSTNKAYKPNENDIQILNAMNYLGLINPDYLVLSATNIEKEKNYLYPLFSVIKLLKNLLK